MKAHIETATLSEHNLPEFQHKRPKRSFPKILGIGCLSVPVVAILLLLFVMLPSLLFTFTRNFERQFVTMEPNFPNIGVEMSHSGIGVAPVSIIVLFLFAAFVGVVVVLIVFLAKKSGSRSQSSPGAAFMPVSQVKFCTHCGAEAGENATACLKCGFALNSKRNFCFHCGVPTDPEQVICIKCGVGFTKPMIGNFVGGQKQKLPAALFAILLGSFGVHKFYLESWGWGIVYFALCWTGISAIAGLIEGILFLVMDDQTFDMRYNQTQAEPFRW